MKRFLAFVLCALLAASLCSCKPSSSAPEVSSEATVSSLPASSAEKLSSAPPASSEAAEKLELEIDTMIDFDTIGYGEYITKDGTLITDDACARLLWTNADHSLCPSADEYGKYLHERFGITENISTAVLDWQGVISGGKICGLVPELIPSGNEAAYDKLRKDAAAIISSWTNVVAVPSASQQEICYPWAYSADTLFTIDSSGSSLSGKSAPLSAEETGAVVIDGTLWLKPDGTLYCKNENFDFSEYSGIVSAYPSSITGNPQGYYLLRADGTLCFADGKGNCEVLKENITKMRNAQLVLDSSNEVYWCREDHTDDGNSFPFKPAGTVSDWHNVAYLKEIALTQTVVAAMKNGTVEVVSPGDAPKALLDFLASVKDLKISR